MESPSYPKLSKTKQAFFKAAEAISQLSDHRCQLGCVVVNNHRIISSGHNSESNRHGFQKRLDEKFFNDGKSKENNDEDNLWMMMEDGFYKNWLL